VISTAIETEFRSSNEMRIWKGQEIEK